MGTFLTLTPHELLFCSICCRDDEGGIPGTHVAQIMGSCQFDASRALAAGVLAYANEPTSGTLCQVSIDIYRAQSSRGNITNTAVSRPLHILHVRAKAKDMCAPACVQTRVHICVLICENSGIRNSAKKRSYMLQMKSHDITFESNLFSRKNILTEVY